MKRVHMLKHYGVKPWVVLDGRRTPMKVRRELHQEFDFISSATTNNSDEGGDM